MLYFLLMGILGGLCILGIVTFVRERGKNFWWRWIYICGGSYLLFDLFAIATRLEFWQKILDKMFDAKATYWNLVWGFFILLGGFVFVLGIDLMIKRKKREVVNEPVVITENIITSCCPQTAPEVAFSLLEMLVGTKEMLIVKRAMGF